MVVFIQLDLKKNKNNIAGYICSLCSLNMYVIVPLYLKVELMETITQFCEAEIGFTFTFIFSYS